MTFVLFHWLLAQAATVATPIVPTDPISGAILTLAGINGLMLFDKVAFWVTKFRRNGSMTAATKDDFERLGDRIVESINELRVEAARLEGKRR